MTMVKTQTLDTSAWDTAIDLLRDARIREKESRWWQLLPGEDGYLQPLHEFLGMTEREWLDYSLSEGRVCGATTARQ